MVVTSGIFLRLRWAGRFVFRVVVLWGEEFRLWVLGWEFAGDALEPFEFLVGGEVSLCGGIGGEEVATFVFCVPRVSFDPDDVDLVLVE